MDGGEVWHPRQGQADARLRDEPKLRPQFFRLRGTECTPIDNLYFRGDVKSLLDSVLSFRRDAPTYELAISSDEEDATIGEIRADSSRISGRLFSVYSRNLQNAVNSVFSSAGGDLGEAAKVNVTKFAYFKAARATRAIRDAEDSDEARDELRKYNRWQSTEYNSAVARSRSAKQWQRFEDNKDVLPNLKWIPSRSVNRREEHIQFYNRVWAKDDPFWSKNQPGNVYGCKCDWVETNEPVTDGNAKGKTKSSTPGLDVNPGIQGELFSMDHPYIAEAKGDEALIRDIAKNEVTYDGVRISVMADAKEMRDNITTGRVLAKGGEDVLIRRDFNMRYVGFAERQRNPEYEINGVLADAKRVHSVKGVAASFKAAVKQGCRAVVIDLDKHQADLDLYVAAAGLYNRHADFERGFVCYIVKNGKYVKFAADDFSSQSKQECINIFVYKLKKALL